MNEQERGILVVSYSQSGQTERMLDAFLNYLAADGHEIRIERLDLGASPPAQNAYPLPWNILNFVREAPAALYPDPVLPMGPIDFDAFEAIVIAYPVWYLSPATPVGAWLRGLPPGSLRGKPIITLSTSRKMWFRAQATVAERVNELGGRIVSHLSIQDRHGNLASMVMTVYFFLTGRRQFQSVWLRRLFRHASYGVSEETFAEFGAWLGLADPGPLESFPSFYDVQPGLMLCEMIGYRVLRGLNRCGRWASNRPRAVEAVYLAALAASTVLAIAVMTPPTLLLARLVPTAKWVRYARQIVLAEKPDC